MLFFQALLPCTALIALTHHLLLVTVAATAGSLRCEGVRRSADNDGWAFGLTEAFAWRPLTLNG